MGLKIREIPVLLPQPPDAGITDRCEATVSNFGANSPALSTLPFKAHTKVHVAMIMNVCIYLYAFMGMYFKHFYSVLQTY